MAKYEVYERPSSVSEAMAHIEELVYNYVDQYEGEADREPAEDPGAEARRRHGEKGSQAETQGNRVQAEEDQRKDERHSRERRRDQEDQRGAGAERASAENASCRSASWGSCSRF